MNGVDINGFPRVFVFEVVERMKLNKEERDAAKEIIRYLHGILYTELNCLNDYVVMANQIRIARDRLKALFLIE